MMLRTLLLCLLAVSTANGEIYRWTDGRGTRHYTNSEYEIPARYRNRAVVLNLGLPAPQGVAPGTTLPNVPQQAGAPGAAVTTPVPGAGAAPLPSPPPVRRGKRQHSADEQ